MKYSVQEIQENRRNSKTGRSFGLIQEVSKHLLSVSCLSPWLSYQVHPVQALEENAYNHPRSLK